jgi:signal transduction histidine kinase
VCIYPSADGLTASFRDMTERYRAEQFKDQILAIVSHDLRHPLSAILLGAQTLLRHGHLDETDAKKTERIVANAHRMERMITQLLDFSRASQPDGFPISTRAVDLHALVRDAVDDALSIAERRRIVVHARATNPVGRWDADRIEQVLQNLIGNAIQHSPDDALVSVTTWDEAGGTLAVCVKNEGPVIPEARLRSIFEPFQREQARGGRPTGLGLGLHIVRSIVRAHGGDIVATSDEHGTAFTVRLPRTRG